MCKLKYWVNDTNGFVATCGQCGNYHLAFGTAMVVVNKTGFEKIAKQVARLVAEEAPQNTSSKYAAICTGTGKNFLVVSYQEALDLNDLIEKAETEMTANAMINMLENG
jgi:hypothetical protein